MSVDPSFLDPTPCNNQTLAAMAALAQQIANPIEPYPLFFNNPQCGGGNLTGSTFPEYFFPVNCTKTVVPDLDDNCLRVLTRAELEALPKIQPRHFNRLPTDDFTSNILAPAQRLRSWYVPPHYTIQFFKNNPDDTEPGALQPDLVITGNQVIVDACLQQLNLKDGSTFFQFQSVTDNLVADCQQKDNLKHRAPYFLVIKEEPFQNLLLDMCVENRAVSVGTTDLRQVWSPQSVGCDSLLNSFCRQADQDDERCACYRQQALLDAKYGEELQVPVCCFGQTVVEADQTCANNETAYKTNSMLQHCCSLAECETVVTTSTALAAATDETGIECQGNFVEFPATPVPVTPDLPVEIIDTQEEIPIWVWAVFMSAIVLLVLFLIALAFL